VFGSDVMETKARGGDYVFTHTAFCVSRLAQAGQGHVRGQGDPKFDEFPGRCSRSRRLTMHFVMSADSGESRILPDGRQRPSLVGKGFFRPH